MADNYTDTQDNLTIIWEKLENSFRPDNSWKDNPKCSEIHQKLLYFAANHTHSPEHIDKVIKCLFRGVRLTEEAINWYEPSIGRKTSSKIHKLRGFQWRLVIAYSGFEITTKALMNHFSRQTSPEIISNFIQKCNLPNYNSLTPPNPQKKDNLEKWLTKDEDAIAEFLGVSAGDKKIIEHWLVKSNSISSWEEAVKLAKALRNASAHGFLSAKKVADWELKPGLNTLANNLGEIMASGLKKLI
ncbi:MAG TPA: hypothetical protein VK203_03665 [Nostocaceae cyanobacterium]|nr:hypothetical protein [Nostocaceae cyanobacterium]